MRSPMRWMTIFAVLAGGVFIGPSPRPLAAADDLPVAGIGAAAEGGDRAGEAGGHDDQPDLRLAPQPRLRATTLRVSPDEHLSRGAAGLVYRGKRRSPYEAVIAEARNDPRLKEYRERRQGSELTVSGQWALADWCRRQRLTDQEQAHLTAVIALDPTHGPAHERLGHVQIAGAWVDADAGAVASQRDKARLSAAALRKHGVTLTSLAKQIGEGAVTPEMAVERVRDLGRQAGIRALELTLSTANEPAAISVVRTLADDLSAEASASLVHHALLGGWPGVRRLAAETLAERDRGSYVPLVIDAFGAPWVSQIEWQRGADGTIFCRQIGFRDGADQRDVTILDHLVVTDWANGRAWAEGTRQVAEGALNQEAQRERENERTAMSNQAIASLLRSTTGESMSDDPDQWRRWWSEETGTYQVGEKPLRVSYRSSTSTAVGVAAPPPPPPPVRRECLAAGTVVWTETGPVAVDRLQPGDVVLTQNQRTGRLGLKPVLLATMRPPEKLLAIELDGETIRATPGHPFWVVGKGWTLARHLEPGNRLQGLDGGGLVERIDEEAKPVRSFNLVVADDHTYFCGKARVMNRDNTDGKTD